MRVRPIHYTTPGITTAYEWRDLGRASGPVTVEGVVRASSPKTVGEDVRRYVSFQQVELRVGTVHVEINYHHVGGVRIEGADAVVIRDDVSGRAPVDHN